MTGEEMKIYLKQSGISLATIAEGLGISPQNLNGKLKAKSLKTDFVAQIRAVIDSYASSLSTEMEGGVMARTSSSRHRNILKSWECAKRCSTRSYGSTKMATYAMKKVIDFPPTESIVCSKLSRAENKIFLVFHD
jgi:hypothetical protein